MNQWQPEREIALTEAVALIRGQFPAVDFDAARILAAGWDNTVVLLDEQWVFRFPRRSIALPGIRREIDWLPWIAGHLAVTVPVPEHVGDYAGWPFWGGRYVPGHELANYPDLDRVPIAATVGAFLRRLHDLAAPWPLPTDPFQRADSATRAPRAREVLAQLSELGLWDGNARIDEILTAGSRLGPVRDRPVLSHGDLYARHVLLRHGHVSGIIDWGDLCLAAPAVDLAIAFSAFTAAARGALFAAYGPVSDETVLRAQTFAIFSAASVAHYAQDTGDPVLLAEALSGLNGVAEH